uniref:Uncharacterized protein n=1 Tax=Panagrolaimus sp. ES5 TaxID=591445 RepID=A0AC34FW22_9BILA
MNRAVGLISIKRMNILLPRTYAITNDKHPKQEPTSSGE